MFLLIVLFYSYGCFECLLMLFSKIYSSFFKMFSLPVFGPPSMICVNPLSVTGLISRLQSTVIAWRAPGTTDAYRRAFARWKSFASSVDEVKVFPARTEHMASYLQRLLDTTHSHSAVDSAIHGIQWAHNLAEIPSPAGSPVIHDVCRAAKTFIGTRLLTRKSFLCQI